MFRGHVTPHLSAYFHGELDALERDRIKAHLEACTRCAAAYAEVRLGASLAAMLSRTPPPDSLWRDLQTAASMAPSRNEWGVRLAAAGVVLSLGLTLFWFAAPPALIVSGPGWVVESVSGTPRVGGSELQEKGFLLPGQTLQTDAASEASVQIANIGRLFVDADTKLRLIVTKSDEHRLSLEHGKVQAQTWAPPRLFIIDTPSATAVDLGCQYTLEVQKDGSSLLHVTLGMVSLENHGREAYVPAHFLARTRTGAGPGTPFREDASEEFQAALNAIDFGPDESRRDSQAAIIAAGALDRDAVTLWHLIPRVGSQVRKEIYNRLAAMTPPPAGVTRDGVLALDPRMLRAWGETIPELWWMKENIHEKD